MLLGGYMYVYLHVYISTHMYMCTHKFLYRNAKGSDTKLQSSNFMT